MSFYKKMKKFDEFDFKDYFQSVCDEDVVRSIEKENLNYQDFLNLLSDRAAFHLEEMAQKAQQLTIQYFGRIIVLYIPLYISNYCSNGCVYCGFNKNNRIERKKLTIEEIEKEAQAISNSGIRHILVLTGEAKNITPLSYLEAAIRTLKKYFSSVTIEVFPMEETEYKTLKEAGADGLTVYQEVYDEEIYSKVHPCGEKSDYRNRLDAPERGAMAGLRVVNIGPLFGLGEIRKEAFFSGMHAKYLQNRFLNTEISISLPRIQNSEGGFKPYCEMDDRTFVQTLLAYRLFLPKVGINISTREMAELRDNLVKLGVTRLSAGSKTTVGGYSKKEKTTPQFEISDTREVSTIVEMIKSKGYQPVFKDWDEI